MITGNRRTKGQGLKKPIDGAELLIAIIAQIKRFR
jgi:hypothetical protein